MGVFKKLTGADVRVTPIRVKHTAIVSDTNTATNSIPDSGAANRSDFDIGSGTPIENEALLHASIRQLYYGAFITKNFTGERSIFDNSSRGGINKPKGTFSRYDPSFQGSGEYSRTLGDTMKVVTYNKGYIGDSLVPGSISGSGYRDDSKGNLVNSSDVIIGNVFYDQGILAGPNITAPNSCLGSYTIYATQYKCTAGPHEFNYTLNPTSLKESTTEYDSDLVNSTEFMPYVTTIGLYNENQELIMVGKLAKPVQLNPHTNTNFIVRLDR